MLTPPPQPQVSHSPLEPASTLEPPTLSPPATPPATPPDTAPADAPPPDAVGEPHPRDDLPPDFWDDLPPPGAEASSGVSAGASAKPPEVAAQEEGGLEADPRFAVLQSLFPGHVVEWQEAGGDEEAGDDESDVTEEAVQGTLHLEDEGADSAA